MISPLRTMYLGLAIWGAVQPSVWFVSFLSDNDWSVGALIAAWHANASTAGLLWDRIVAVVALTVWVLAEVAVRRNWLALIAIPASWVIGLGCGLPLYLFLRTRPVV